MVVRIVTNLYLLDVEYRGTGVLDSEVTIGDAASTLGFYNNLVPFARLERPGSVRTVTLDLVAGEGDIVGGILVGLRPEGDGIGGEGVNLEAFDNADIGQQTNLEGVLVIVFRDAGRTAFYGSGVVTHAHLVEVHCLSLYVIHRDLDGSREHIQPVVGLVGIGHDRTAEHLASDFLNVVEKILHIEEVHDTLGINDGSRHQSRAECEVVEIGDSDSMGQLLLVELCHLKLCAE